MQQPSTSKKYLVCFRYFRFFFVAALGLTSCGGKMLGLRRPLFVLKRHSRGTLWNDHMIAQYGRECGCCPGRHSMRLSSVRPCHNTPNFWEFCKTFIPVPETSGSIVRLLYPYPESTNPTEPNLGNIDGSGRAAAHYTKQLWAGPAGPARPNPGPVHQRRPATNAEKLVFS